jgi:hypothetical protein
MDQNELVAAEFLTQRGLRAERFTKEEQRRGKTPDFRVFRADELACYCEVKSIDQDMWLDAQLAAAPPMTIVGGGRHDPTFNRLTDDIHEAVKQLNAVNPDVQYPNLVVFVNNDVKCGVMDLLGVTTGNFFAADGKRIPIYRCYSEGRIRDEKYRIHLYVWVTPGVREQFLFNRAHEAHFNRLCALFQVDPGQVPDAGA